MVNSGSDETRNVMKTDQPETTSTGIPTHTLLNVHRLTESAGISPDLDFTDRRQSDRGIDMPASQREVRLSMTAQRHKQNSRYAAAALLLATLAGGCCSRSCGLGCGLALPHCDIANHSRNMVPQVYPLGSVMRSHLHTEQTNAEATDFVFNLVHFTGETAHLTPDGKDHLMEVAARMRSAPFPVLIERTPNNANPQLDAERRVLVARYLADLGNPDADQRTIVAVPYDRGFNSFEGEADYYSNFNFQGNQNNFGNGGGATGYGGSGLGNGFGGGFY